MLDLAAYVNRVPSLEDRVLLQEASACLRAGANRAAYITLWLATAESLRRKFVEAQTFDSEAGRIVTQIEQREAQHKAIDGLLIRKAKDYGFVSDSGATRLQHLYENRNLYGHPYEESPSNEAVVAAAADAVEIVLEQPATLRHGYLDRQAVRITGDLAYLSDDREAVEQHADVVRTRSAIDLHPWFVRKVVRALDAVFADPGNDRLQRRGVWFLRRFLLEGASIFELWDAAEDLPDHPAVLPGTFAHETLFCLISDHARDIVVNSLCLSAAADPRNISLLWPLRGLDDFAPRHLEQLEATVAGMPLSRLSGTGLPLSAYWARVVASLATHSWDSQNEGIRLLRTAGADQVATLEVTAQEQLGRNVMQAAEGSAWAAIGMLRELRSSDPCWPAEFLRGVVFEPFLTTSSCLRLKTDQLQSAVSCLAATDAVTRDRVIDELCAAIGSAGVREWHVFDHRRPSALASLETAAQIDGLSRLVKVGAALSAVLDSGAAEGAQ